MLNSCVEQTEWTKYGLNGKVKTLVENQYEPVEKSGKWQQGAPTRFGNYSLIFSEKGDHERTNFFDENNKIRYYLISKIENGKMVEESRYDAEGKFQGINKYTHTSDTKIEFTSYEPYEGELIEVSKGTDYLKDGKPVGSDLKTLYNGEVNYEVQKKFLYDENGFLVGIKKSFPVGDDEIEKFEYTEFDDQNNWTKRLYYEDEDSKTPHKIIIRSYEYYK